MSVKLLTEYRLEFLSLKGGCTGSSECTPAKMPHCWKSHALARIADSFSTVLFSVVHFNLNCYYFVGILHVLKVLN